MNVKIVLLNQEFFQEFGVPQYATPGSAAFDLRACIQSRYIKLQKGERHLIPTGLGFKFNGDKDYDSVGLFLLPRSGLGHNKGLILGNAVGLVDSDYAHEVFISAWASQEDLVINKGDRICQAVFLPVIKAEFEVVGDKLADLQMDTERQGGFGSTGRI